MTAFLKSFLVNEKSPEEKALAAPQKKMRDVMSIADFAMDEDEDEESGNCGAACSGCRCAGG